jgi:hypothetical protein
MLEAADPLNALSAKVEEELAVGMAVGSLSVEGLEMPVHPQIPHGPVSATQAEFPKEDRPDRSSH